MGAIPFSSSFQKKTGKKPEILVNLKPATEKNKEEGESRREGKTNH